MLMVASDTLLNTYFSVCKSLLTPWILLTILLFSVVNASSLLILPCIIKYIYQLKCCDDYLRGSAETWRHSVNKCQIWWYRHETFSYKSSDKEEKEFLSSQVGCHSNRKMENSGGRVDLDILSNKRWQEQESVCLRCLLQSLCYKVTS